MVIYTLATDKEAPISSTPILVLAVGIAVYWFTKIYKRKMNRTEILRFSVGNVLADLVFSVIWTIGMLWLLGVPFNWEGLSTVFGGDGSAEAAKVGVLVGLLVGLPQVLVVSGLFGWLITRKLPEKSPIVES